MSLLMIEMNDWNLKQDTVVLVNSPQSQGRSRELSLIDLPHSLEVGQHLL